MVYLPRSQSSWSMMTFVVKTAGDPLALAAAARARVAEVDPLLPLAALQSYDDMVKASVESERAQTVLMGAFGLLALLLAVVGIYGVTSQLVAARVPEIGVRMSLGARPRDVLRQVLREGTWQAAIGIAVGLAAGALLMRLGESLLFEVRPWDPITLTGVALLLLAAALVACLIPARRAMRVDPVDALRGN
jgi:ABC-type antimicrobial peptide transport system permease subunit